MYPPHTNEQRCKFARDPCAQIEEARVSSTRLVFLFQKRKVEGSEHANEVEKSSQREDVRHQRS